MEAATKLKEVVMANESTLRFAPPARLSNEELMRRKHRAAALRRGEPFEGGAAHPSEQDIADAGAEDPALVADWLHRGLIPGIGVKPRRGAA
jgi:hypothetical protein